MNPVQIAVCLGGTSYGTLQLRAIREATEPSVAIFELGSFCSVQVQPTFVDVKLFFDDSLGNTVDTVPTVQPKAGITFFYYDLVPVTYAKEEKSTWQSRKRTLLVS